MKIAGGKKKKKKAADKGRKMQELGKIALGWVHTLHMGPCGSGL